MMGNITTASNSTTNNYDLKFWNCVTELHVFHNYKKDMFGFL